MKKICFIHIPKTGGESILYALRREAGLCRTASKLGYPVRHLTLINHPIFPKHDTLAQVEARFDLSNREIFAVARNPWARMLSLYQHLRRWTYDPRYNRRLPNPQIAAGFASHFEFNKWLNYMLVEKVKQLESVRETNPTDHFMSVCSFLRSEEEARQVKVLRLENLSVEFNRFMKDTGRAVELPPSQKNKSEGFVGRYTEVYSSESRRIIEKVYSDDIEKFEYTF